MNSNRTAFLLLAACLIFTAGCAGHQDSRRKPTISDLIGTEKNWDKYDADGWQKLIPCGEWCSYKAIPPEMGPEGPVFYQLSLETQKRIIDCEGRCAIILDKKGVPAGITAPGKLGSHGGMSFLMGETFWAAIRALDTSDMDESKKTQAKVHVVDSKKYLYTHNGTGWDVLPRPAPDTVYKDLPVNLKLDALSWETAETVESCWGRCPLIADTKTGKILTLAIPGTFRSPRGKKFRVDRNLREAIRATDKKLSESFFPRHPDTYRLRWREWKKYEDEIIQFEYPSGFEVTKALSGSSLTWHVDFKRDGKNHEFGRMSIVDYHADDKRTPHSFYQDKRALYPRALDTFGPEESYKFTNTTCELFYGGNDAPYDFRFTSTAACQRSNGGFFRTRAEYFHGRNKVYPENNYVTENYKRFLGSIHFK